MRVFKKISLMALLMGLGGGYLVSEPALQAEDQVQLKPGGKVLTQTMPSSDIKFDMVPIPGGEFTFGSPDSEADRREDEGPVFKVKIEPFYMLKTEVTWEMYKLYMQMYDPMKKLAKDHPLTDKNKSDAITVPTPLYEPSFTFELGQDPKEPAVSMTPYSARQFCKWLSKTTGRFYRLPTEAEWEYACRAGTKTAYSWGDDADKIDDYAWYFDNAEDKYQRVGLKKPNPWGLYDMHGNVAELVIDQFDEKHYKQFADGKVHHWSKIIKWADKPKGRVYRGGSWDSDPEDLRSAARLATDDKEWKIDDPNLPKSPWWYTQARFVGFRFIHPLKVPDAKEQEKYWRTHSEFLQEDVDSRIQEGRGIIGVADEKLPDRAKKVMEKE